MVLLGWNNTSLHQSKANDRFLLGKMAPKSGNTFSYEETALHHLKKRKNWSPWQMVVPFMECICSSLLQSISFRQLFLCMIGKLLMRYLICDNCFRRIGIEANEELRSIFKRDVHLILQVRVAKKRSA